MNKIEILKNRKELYEKLLSQGNLLKEAYIKEIQKINEEIEKEDLFIQSIDANNESGFMYVKLSDSNIQKKIYYKSIYSLFSYGDYQFFLSSDPSLLREYMYQKIDGKSLSFIVNRTVYNFDITRLKELFVD